MKKEIEKEKEALEKAKDKLDDDTIKGDSFATRGAGNFSAKRERHK